ncbi:MAG TPA: hypothetical protein VFY93_03810 [Planctomycetota bacterium]|nr:hypothetical protein [Planctomycetota bacterium]
MELTGSEPFVLRQLKLLSGYLGRADARALDDAPVEEAAPVEPPPNVAEPGPRPEAREALASPEPPAAPAAEPALPATPTNGGHAAPRPGNGGGEAADELIRFYGRFQPQGLDRQSDAALLFAYYLQQREGQTSLQLGDLIRCCIRAGVDTRNFNRTLGILTRRGYLETVRHGHAYRLSEHGVAAVESRM